MLLRRAGLIGLGSFVVSTISAYTFLLATDMAAGPSGNTDIWNALTYFAFLSIVEGFAGSCGWEFVNYSRKNGRVWELRWSRYLDSLRRSDQWDEYRRESIRFEEASLRAVPDINDAEVIVKVLKRAAIAAVIYLLLTAAVAVTLGVFVLGALNGSGDLTKPLFVSLSLTTGYVALAVWAFSLVARRRWAELSAERLAPRAATLADRVAAAQQKVVELSTAIGTTASEVTAVIDSLQRELKARSAALDVLAAEARSAQERADKARARANINEDSARAVDALLDARAAEREATNRRWDVKMLFVSMLLGIPPGVAATVITARLHW